MGTLRVLSSGEYGLTVPTTWLGPSSSESSWAPEVNSSSGGFLDALSTLPDSSIAHQSSDVGVPLSKHCFVNAGQCLGWSSMKSDARGWRSRDFVAVALYQWLLQPLPWALSSCVHYVHTAQSVAVRPEDAGGVSSQNMRYFIIGIICSRHLLSCRQRAHCEKREESFWRLVLHLAVATTTHYWKLFAAVRFSLSPRTTDRSLYS